jgi:D-alanyl-lipoteichoic acid acyltransferase DltB (MBOAT superfamily)
VVADNLGAIVGPAYANPSACSGPLLVWASFCFLWQIYFDFAAYSDIATGTAQLFGFRLMRNFAYPHFAQTMGEHWRRWHISLSTWFRDYLFTPLGGSLAPPARRCWAIFATFVLSGLWHGAAWHFVVWGAFHGLLLMPGMVRRPPRHVRRRDLPGGNRLLPTPAVALRIGRTVFLNCVGAVLFRAASLGDAVTIYGRILGDLANGTAYAELFHLLGTRDLTTAVFLAAVVLAEWVRRNRRYGLEELGWPRACRWALYTLLLWAIFYWGAEQSGEFIYFQF